MQIDYNLIERIESLVDRGVSYTDIAKLAGVKQQTVKDLVEGNTYNHMQKRVHALLVDAINAYENDLVEPLKPRRHAEQKKLGTAIADTGIFNGPTLLSACITALIACVAVGLFIGPPALVVTKTELVPVLIPYYVPVRVCTCAGYTQQLAGTGSLPWTRPR